MIILSAGSRWISKSFTASQKMFPQENRADTMQIHIYVGAPLVDDIRSLLQLRCFQSQLKIQDAYI